MNENWGEVRKQLDEVLASERAQHQARHQSKMPFWQHIQAWWSTHFIPKRRRDPLAMAGRSPQSRRSL
jgi:hypothetical protein